MDRIVPQAAAYLLDFIGDIEAPKGYNTIFGNNQHLLKKPLTEMTVDEVIAAGPSWTKKYRSSAAGRYQFMNATLIELKKELKLKGTQLFSADLQDRLGYHLLRRRGYDRFMQGSLAPSGFALNLAKEWASLPVWEETRAHKRVVQRGQSYYAGDALNKSLVSADRFESVVLKAKNLPNEPIGPIVTTVHIQEEAPKYPGTMTALIDTSASSERENSLMDHLNKVSSSLRAVNPEQMATLLRHGLQLGAGMIIATGYVTEEQYMTVGGALVTLITFIWGSWARSDKSLMESAAAVPAVKSVVVSSERVASKVPDHRVATSEQAKRAGLI